MLNRSSDQGKWHLTRGGLKFVELPLISLVCVLSSVAIAQVDKIDGYDGFVFGTTIEQATVVRPGSRLEPCGFAGVVG